MHVGGVGDETFFVGNVKHGSMIDFCVFGEAAAELAGIPGVEMGVEVQNGHWAPGFVESAEDWESCELCQRRFEL